MTSTDLVIPNTGEVVSLEDPEQCARALRDISDLEYKIREMKGVLRGVVVEESIKQGSKTIHFSGGMTAKITTANDISWDYDILLELVDAGLPEERFNLLVLTEVTYKVSGAIARELSGANPQYAEILERAKTSVPRTPSVSVSSTKRVDG